MPFLQNRTFYFVLATLAGFAGYSSADAATLKQPFSSPQGGVPTGWELVQNGSTGSYTAGISEVVAEGGDWRMLMLRNDGAFTSNSTNQNLFYTEEKIADFDSEVVFRVYGGSAGSLRISKGLVARSSELSANGYGGYHAYVSGDSNNNYTLTLSMKEAGTSSQWGTTILASDDLTTALAANTDYLLRFSARGDTLSASIYRADGEGNYTVELASVSGQDSTYATGYFGLKSTPNGVDRGVYFSDFELTVIPEPGALTLGALGLALLGCVGRRQSR
ncbi:MAG TPA: PEP-CTERM sorting domain-containing protein [Chthoniobacteraceae bacterium]|nr:PEP-CTERM sorting domain-containing protein [Chthoniobacteraceae bacterium]